ncbi:hypothetical protein [Haloarcula sp. H-GB5]
MSETTYKPGEFNITCRECGGEEYDTLEAQHFQSDSCTGEVSNVEEYRKKHPDAPTRTTAFKEKVES